MNVTYEKKDAMTFIGYHTEIRPEEGYQKCPEFCDADGEKLFIESPIRLKGGGS